MRFVELHRHGWIDMRLAGNPLDEHPIQQAPVQLSASWRPITARPLPYSPPMVTERIMTLVW